MAYGSNVTKIKEQSPLSFGIHTVNLASIVFSKTTPADATKEPKEIVTLRFEDAKGGYFEHSEYNPDTDTNEVRQAKNQEWLSNLFTYIASKVYKIDKGDSKVQISSKVASWEDLKKDIEARIFKDDYTQTALRIKLLGNVYNGKARVIIPKYFPFLENVDLIKENKKPDLSFGDSEKTRCLEYKNAIENPAAASSSSNDVVGAGLDGNGKDDDLPF